jgi:hypothetical protein
MFNIRKVLNSVILLLVCVAGTINSSCQDSEKCKKTKQYIQQIDSIIYRNEHDVEERLRILYISAGKDGIDRGTIINYAESVKKLSFVSKQPPPTHIQSRIKFYKELLRQCE